MHGCYWAEGVVQGVVNVHGEGSDTGRRRVCLLVGRELSAQTKVELDHPVFPGVVGPHRGKYFSNGAYILIH